MPGGLFGRSVSMREFPPRNSRPVCVQGPACGQLMADPRSFGGVEELGPQSSLVCHAIQVSAQGVKLRLDLLRTPPDNHQHHNDQDGRREENH
jgi:hypothetical protein